MKDRILIILCAVVAMVILGGCDPREHPDMGSPHKKELLVYSGMTMVKPLLELVEIMERQHECEIKVTYGGSGHIAKSVRINQVGDLFFPGDSSFIRSLQDEGLVSDVVEVGYNQAALFVQRGNPLHIEASLDELADPGYNVVLGNEFSGAIGRETKNILLTAGLYDRVVENVLYMATDSKGLAQAIRHQDADLVMNWKAVASLPENKYVMEVLALPEEIAGRHPLQMGLLSYSRQPELARLFLELAHSERGRDIFRRYGFVD
nr:substrate-binding domain-containing protein [uncultured Desulfuromonas sp.]